MPHPKSAGSHSYACRYGIREFRRSNHRHTDAILNALRTGNWCGLRVDEQRLGVDNYRPRLMRLTS